MGKIPERLGSIQVFARYSIEIDDRDRQGSNHFAYYMFEQEEVIKNVIVVAAVGNSHSLPLGLAYATSFCGSSLLY